ncbi:MULTISPECIES: hypothetical protein [Methylobacterium]|uniref:hypothetical protein n=1 Tax=Methylobacterium TaxID=407 RepID=UPI0013ED83E3|nr:hypothetical protein [Methylobacterium sp. DB0501]NGM34984.1 hypothetical protein [Methylobacterium sp. DB0501]
MNPTQTLRPRTVPVPRGRVRPPPMQDAAGTVEDGYRYRTIGSAHALLIAVAASLLVTVLFRVVL